MGESTTIASNNEVKMGETAPSNPVLGVSVSFGRFENDSLSWEKWSSFSPNKYLEEVEKCATPGSVAQKKAYFEEHYKKIAARKAELLDQEKQMESKPVKLDDEKSADLNGNTDDAKYGSGASNGQYFDELEQGVDLATEVKNIDAVNEPSEKAAVIMECPNSFAEEVREEIESIDSGLENPKLNEPQETVADEVILVKENSEILPKVSQNTQELPKKLEKERERTPKTKVKNVKLEHPVKSHKVTPMSKERNSTRITKKPASPAIKSPQFSTPRAPKPASTPTKVSASRSSIKTGTTSLPKAKIPSAGESRKVASKSLHMSLSLGPSVSDPAPLATTRKSFIMEKMGDKDIVKRAFKTFQNSYSQLRSSTREKPSAGKQQVQVQGAESKVSELTTPKKDNGGSLKSNGMDKRNAKAAPSFGLKSDERTEKNKLSRKLDEKLNSKERQKTHLKINKDDYNAESKNLRHSRNSKETPMLGSYHGKKILKSPLDKDGTKREGHR